MEPNEKDRLDKSFEVIDFLIEHGLDKIDSEDPVQYANDVYDTLRKTNDGPRSRELYQQLRQLLANFQAM